MFNFGWSHSIAYIMGQVVETMIILIVVAVVAALIFLLTRYLLVATRAAQLYVAQHEPPRLDPEPADEPTAPAKAVPSKKSAEARPAATSRAPKTPPTA